MSKIILLSGIPASGKSTYGKWLEREKGYIYWDVENEDLEAVNERSRLTLGFGKDINGLLEFAKDLTQPIVIDWGFPPDTALSNIKALKDYGVDIWWFDGDREAARASFLQRDTVPEEALDIQIKKVDQYWEEISELYKNRILNTIRSGPSYISSEELFKTVQ